MTTTDSEPPARPAGGRVCACLLAVSVFPRSQTTKNVLAFVPTTEEPVPKWHFLLHEDNAFPSVSFDHVTAVVRADAKPASLRVASDLNPRPTAGKGIHWRRFVVEAEFDHSIERIVACDSVFRELNDRFGWTGTDKGKSVVRGVWETIAFINGNGVRTRGRYEVDISMEVCCLLSKTRQDTHSDACRRQSPSCATSSKPNLCHLGACFISQPS